MSMRAIEVREYGSSDVLQVHDVEEPTPGPGEVSIEVRAVGVNFADIKRRRGASHRAAGPPFVPGIEAAGVVHSVGEGVSREPGERVAAYVSWGAYAERVVAEEHRVIDIPDGMSFEEAAGFPVNYLTAHNALFEWGGLEAGERVLVHAAAGGVGSAAVQLARSADAEVFATASTDEKLDLASRLGADHPINYAESDFVDAVDGATDGAGVDLVIDGVGGDAFDGSLDALAPFGRLVSVGSASGREGTLDPSLLRVGNQRIIGYHLGTAMEREPARVEPAITSLYELVESGEIEVVVDRTFPLEEAAKAHDRVESRRSVGKVILLP